MYVTVFIYVRKFWKLNLPSSSSSVGPVANATDVLQPSRLIVLTLSPPPVWTLTRSPPVTPTSTMTRENLVELCGWELTGNFHVNSGIFYMLQICDMGPTALLPFRRKACWRFFCAEKSWRLRSGLNPQTWVLKGSTPPLDHRSRLTCNGYWNTFKLQTLSTK